MKEIIHQHIKQNGSYPNNDALPLLILQSAIKGAGVSPDSFEKVFTDNGWPAAWRNGIFNFHHFHSTAHEVLGVYSGKVQVCFGGPGGKIFEARAGDIIVIPAGVAHCNNVESSDFKVVGAYPEGQIWDMRRGNPEELPEVLSNIENVPLPTSDPFYGAKGPLMQFWR
jgi:uncharacterized protein YjlB